MIKSLSRIKRSIFTKLLLVIVTAGFLVNLFVGGFVRTYFLHGRHEMMKQNMRAYIDYIVQDIGVPPNISRAREIAERNSYIISLKGPDIVWSSEAGYENINLKEIHLRHRFARGWFGRYRKKFFLSRNKNGYAYTFIMKNPPDGEGREQHLVILIVLLTGVLFGAYMLIRKMLRPISLLDEGVKQAAAGKLDYRVPVTGTDELGELTESFNRMQHQIQETLQARKQLLIDVSHELRSPLTRIKVALEFLNDEKIGNSISDDIKELELMIDELLEAERLEQGNRILKIERVDIITLIKEAARAVSLPEEGIRFIEEQESLFLNADRHYIMRVLTNILSNAMKYSETGKYPVGIYVEEDEKETTIIIADHGEGIPAEKLPFVFEPFYRADRSRSRKSGGYGLGLSLCKKIMEAHGGSIKIESGAGNGTRVFLVFPTPSALLASPPSMGCR